MHSNDPSILTHILPSPQISSSSVHSSMSADTKLKCNCCYIQKIDFYAELGKADSKFAEVNCQVKVSSETQYQPIIGK